MPGCICLKPWANDPERCGRAAIPEPFRCFHSKSNLALEMLEDAIRRGVRFGYVGIDGGYGKEPAFLRGADGLNCRFVADVHCDQTIYLENPDPKVSAWKGRGKRPERLQAQCDGMRLDVWADRATRGGLATAGRARR